MDKVVVKLRHDGQERLLIIDSEWEAAKFLPWAREFGFNPEVLPVANHAGSCNEAIQMAWGCFGLPHGGRTAA